MTETSYWMRLPADGTFALIDGDAERDRLTPFGWEVADEPRDTDFVWARHPDIELPARYPFASLDYWQAQGWEPGAPPLRVELTKDPIRTDPAPAPAAPAINLSGKPARGADNVKER